MCLQCCCSVPGHDTVQGCTPWVWARVEYCDTCWEHDMRAKVPRPGDLVMFVHIRYGSRSTRRLTRSDNKPSGRSGAAW